MFIIEFDNTDLRLQAKSVLTDAGIKFEDGKTYRLLIVYTENKRNVTHLLRKAKIKGFIILS